MSSYFLCSYSLPITNGDHYTIQKPLKYTSKRRDAKYCNNLELEIKFYLNFEILLSN